MYKEIFLTNILQLLEEKNLNYTDLSVASGISLSYVSDICKGKANVTLKQMEAISEALGKPLPLMLTNVEPEVWASIEAMSVTKPMAVPKDDGSFQYISGYLPEHQAFIVHRWMQQADKKRGKTKKKA